MKAGDENGRVERLNREVWQAVRKVGICDRGKTIQEILKAFEEKQNNTYHRGIAMTPNEAWANPDSEILKYRNSKESRYAKEFSQTTSEKFEEDDKVAVEASPMGKQKKSTSRFDRTGKIRMKLDRNRYLIESRNRLFKKSHSQLKKLVE